MKSLLVSCLIVAVLAVGALSQLEICEPGELVMTECGLCICNPDGVSVTCDSLGCTTYENVPKLQLPEVGRRTARAFRGSRRSPYRAAGAKCIPGQLVKVDCNYCICVSPGVLGPCTLMNCP